MARLYPPSDTSLEAHQVQLTLLRQTPPIDRLRKAMGLSRQVKSMAMDAIRRRHPELDENGVRLRFIEIAYGKHLADEVKHWQEQKTIG